MADAVKADAANIIGGALPGILGLGLKLGLGAGQLKKPKKINTSKKAVADAATQMANAAMGAAAGRGGAAAYASREAARTGAQAAGNAAQAYAGAAAQDEQTYQALKLNRAQALAGLGDDLAAFTAETGMGVVEARQAAKAGEQDAALAKEAGSFGVQNTGYPSGGQTAPWNVQATPLQEPGPGGVVSQTPGEQRGILPNAPAQQLGNEQGVVSEPPPAQSGYAPVQPVSFHETQRNILRRATNNPQRPSLYSINMQEENKLRLENLVWDEVERSGMNPDIVRARIARYMAKMQQFQFSGLSGDTQVS